MAPWLQDSLRDLTHLSLSNSSPILVHSHQAKGLLGMVDQFLSYGLCENPQGERTCDICAGCKMRLSGNHPDVQYLTPQDKALELGLHIDIKATTKPSKEIRVDDVRALQAFINTGASRGKNRYLVVYPFDALNLNSANALLKMLEEPTNNLLYLLVGHKADSLLPTIRSRCQVLTVPAPNPVVSIQWLQSQGVQAPDVSLSLAMNDPFEALALSQEQIELLSLRKRWVDWLACPEHQNNFPFGSEKLGLPVLLELAARLSHDLMHLRHGAMSQNFPWLAPKLVWVKSKSTEAISNIYQKLHQQTAFADHPLNPRLALEFLAQQWQTELSLL